MQNVITHDAVIGVSNPDLTLFPGMTANVKILVAERPKALRIPNGALRYHPPNVATAVRASTSGKANHVDKAIWILDANDTARRVAISTGETDGTFTEVTGGSLHAGDRAIVAALSNTTSAAGGGSNRGAGRGPGF